MWTEDVKGKGTRNVGGAFHFRVRSFYRLKRNVKSNTFTKLQSVTRTDGMDALSAVTATPKKFNTHMAQQTTRKTKKNPIFYSHG